MLRKSYRYFHKTCEGFYSLYRVVDSKTYDVSIVFFSELKQTDLTVGVLYGELTTRQY